MGLFLGPDGLATRRDPCVMCKGGAPPSQTLYLLVMAAEQAPQGTALPGLFPPRREPWQEDPSWIQMFGKSFYNPIVDQKMPFKLDIARNDERKSRRRRKPKQKQKRRAKGGFDSSPQAKFANPRKK